MSLLLPFMVANADSGAQLSLSPQSGQSLKVVGLFASFESNTNYTIEISKSTVGYFRQLADASSVLSFPQQSSYKRSLSDGIEGNLFDWLVRKTDFTGYPVAEGETFRVVPESGTIDNVSVVYQVYDAGDMQSSMPDGSAASVYHVMNYGYVSAGAAAAGLSTYNDTYSPVQFPAFPFGSSVPSNTKIDLLGIVGLPFLKAEGTADKFSVTQYLKLTRDRTVLFDEDKNGLPNFGALNTTTTTDIIGTGYSILGACTGEFPEQPFVPINLATFQSGDELLVEVYMSATGGGKASAAGDNIIGFIEKISVS